VITGPNGHVRIEDTQSPTDPARRLPPFFHDEPHQDKSLPFLYLNTNKRSITLNLKSETGRGILLDLLAETDVVVENFAPRVMGSLGLDYDTLREHNPRLVFASVSNFGQSGPWRDYRASEIVAYALGGLMYIFGAYDREPLKHALHQAQFKAGTNLASATLMALYHQRLTGEGQRVDVSIQESIASALRDVTNNYTYTGAVRCYQQLYVHGSSAASTTQSHRRSDQAAGGVGRVCVAEPGARRVGELAGARGLFGSAGTG
jgi:crotonobetainyl-CoA:carnitine CoA-transferase CaiB-like acyl-CoA transferase